MFEETKVGSAPATPEAAGRASVFGLLRGVDIDAPPLRALHPRSRRVSIDKSAPVGGAIKRSLDITAAAMLLVLLAPLMALVALTIAAVSPGPVLFKQRRGGFRGRPFIIYKFRTMRVCDDGDIIVQAEKNDARVTAFGSLLRKTSLDELPQLFNVLKGDMSIVGPRPHALAHDRAFAAIDTAYLQRARARPGITGLAQVSGSRGVTDTADAVRERVRLDLAYIHRWSPLLDVWIVVRTAALVFGDCRAF